ncbi:MAG: Gfo/Idh/MocA family oxidoreductase [Anaerohalosphaera sp.]|nr:Gfo/Idh/MocA family oxidoreductase [Anaerohalosphaera sp.]
MTETNKGRTIRWGIIGTGKIAAKFASDLAFVDNAELVAIASRNAETAKSFAKKFSIPNTYSSYEAITADPDIDIIYVATVNTLHMENTLTCLNAGKSVLCEKPFALNADQAQKMIETAHKKKLYLAEAMWTRFVPLTVELRRIIASGTIGEIKMLHADFCFTGRWAPQSRLLNPDLGGGALLDIGIYPVSFASMLLNCQPNRIATLANMAQTGVDEQAAFIFQYDTGALAVLSCAINAQTHGQAVISGGKGTITVHPPFWHSSKMTITANDGSERTVEMPYQGNGLHYQAVEANRCINNGLTETPAMPQKETLAIMKTLDTIRGQWKLKYPVEKD